MERLSNSYAALGKPLPIREDVAGPVVKQLVDMARKELGSTGGQGVPAFWFARAIETGSQENLTEPYRNSVWVQRAIKKIAGPVAAVEVVFMDSSSGERTASRTKGVRQAGRKLARVWGRKAAPASVDRENFVDESELADWLQEPAPGLTWSDFVEASIGWLKLRGEYFWVLSDEMLMPFPEVRKGPLPPLVVARPDRMRHVIENGQLKGWDFRDGAGKAHALLPDQVIQVKYWNPYDQWRGLGEFDSAQLAAESTWLAGKFARNLMANNGDTGPYIVAKNGVPTDPQREQIIADLKAKREAQLRGNFRPIFLTGDISVEDPQIKTVDGNFVAQNVESRHEIAAAFGVPMSMFDVRNDYSMGSQSAYYQLILDTCIPTGAKVCDGLERLVRKVSGKRLSIGLLWDEHPVLQTVRRERIDTYEKLCNRGMPPKDASAYLLLDLPEFDGDDVGLVPMNLVPVATVEAEPDPSTDISLAELPREPQLPATDEQAPAVKAMLKALQTPRGNTKALARKKLWERHMRARTTTVKVFESKFNRVLNEWRGKVLKKLEEYGAATEKAIEGAHTKSLVDLIFNPNQFGRELVAAFGGPTQQALQTAADQLRADELGLDDPWKFPPQKALEFVQGRTQSVMKCGDTVRSQINTAVSEGLEGGETMEDLSDRVRGVFNALSKGEADRVARTETGMAFGFSRNTAMKASGVRYKKWLSSHGLNVRTAHQEADDQPAIPMDEPFEVGGEELMYPGDPSGSPENIINCQCVQIAAEPP